MRIRPSVVVGFGVGYVLGSRAGRERYDAILRQIRTLQERPELQSVAGVVSAQISGAVEQARRAVGGRFGRSDVSTPYIGTATHGSANGMSTRISG